MSKFEVVLKNSVVEGVSPEEVKENLTQLLKLDAYKVNKLMNRPETVIKKGIESEVAERYRVLLEKCGVGCEIRPVQSVEATPDQMSVPSAEISPDERLLITEKKPKRFEPVLVDLTYDQIPFFRKGWFIASTLILFVPLAFFLLVSGDVYAKRNENVYKFSKSLRWILAASSFMLTLNVALRVLR